MDNQTLIELVDRLRALPKEITWVEFKAGDATTNEKLGQYISGISNAACLANEPYGYLIFGINDQTHDVTGTSFTFQKRKQGNQDLELWIRDLLQPSIAFTHHICTHTGKRLEVFRIPAAQGQPTDFKNVSYTRVNESLTQLKKYPEQIRTIYNSQEDWSAKIIEEANIDDLDPEALKLAREKFKEKKSGTLMWSQIDQWDDETFLDKAKITIHGKITNTAIILLGKPESAHFISPAVAQITWKLDTGEKAYEHFDIPFLESVNAVSRRIRNVKYKFFPDNQLLSVEVNKYENKVILEALNNCIAHQDYRKNARIVLTEQIEKLIFTNAGDFFEGSAEEYSSGTKTPERYRNKWLVSAMVNLGMIDSMGYGIHTMYLEQRKRYFPLPDYSKSGDDSVVLEIYGHTIDENYSKTLIEKQDLALTDVILLDKVQKKQRITIDAAKFLKTKGLIEGRKPNYHISSSVASATGREVEYLKDKGIEDAYCKQLIQDYLRKFHSGKRPDFENLLFEKLPGGLTDQQKKDKVKNLLQALRREGKIYLDEGAWRLNPQSV